MNAPRFEQPRAVLETLGISHTMYRLQPSHDPSLAYRILVPKDWQVAQRVQLGLGATGSPERIGYFAPSTPSSASLTVSATRIGWDVDPLAWVSARWIIAGWRLHATRWLDDRRFEVSASFGEGRDGRVRRSVGFTAEGRIVRVDAESSYADWSHWHDLLWPSTELLALEHGAGVEAIEARTRHEGPLVRFAVPESWGAEPVEHADLRRVSWFVTCERDVQHGALLRVDGHAEPVDPRARSDRLLRSLAGAGVILREPLRPIDPPRGPRGATPELVEGTYRARARHDQDDIEIRLVQLSDTRRCADALMLAPPPGTHHLDWMRATRALEIVVETLELQPCVRAESGTAGGEREPKA